MFLHFAFRSRTENYHNILRLVGVLCKYLQKTISIIIRRLYIFFKFNVCRSPELASVMLDQPNIDPRLAFSVDVHIKEAVIKIIIILLMKELKPPEAVRSARIF